MLGWLLYNIYFAESNLHDMIDMKDNTMTWKAIDLCEMASEGERAGMLWWNQETIKLWFERRVWFLSFLNRIFVFKTSSNIVCSDVLFFFVLWFLVGVANLSDRFTSCLHLD